MYTQQRYNVQSAALQSTYLKTRKRLNSLISMPLLSTSIASTCMAVGAQEDRITRQNN